MCEKRKACIQEFIEITKGKAWLIQESLVLIVTDVVRRSKNKGHKSREQQTWHTIILNKMLSSSLIHNTPPAESEHQSLLIVDSWATVLSHQLFEAWVWQWTMVGSCNKEADVSAGLEACNRANAARVSGNWGGVAGVLVGTIAC